MSATMNKVMIMGNLGRDPELRTTQGGQSVCDLGVATHDAWTDRSGQRQERTEWHRVVVWGRDAENATRFLKKGSSVLVEGRLQTREYEDREGHKRTSTEIVASTLTFLPGGPRSVESEAAV